MLAPRLKTTPGCVCDAGKYANGIPLGGHAGWMTLDYNTGIRKLSRARVRQSGQAVRPQ